MADQNNTILFTAVFDADKAEANVIQLTKTLAFLRAEKAALEKDFKAGAVNLDDYNKSTVALGRSIALTEASLASETKAVADNDKAQKLAQLSVMGMKSALGQLGVRYVSLTKSTQDSTATTADAAKQNKAYSGSITELDARVSELKKQYNGLSQAKREDVTVGGALLTQINALTAQQEKNQKVVENSRKTARDYIKDINVLGINVGSTVESFKSGTQGVATFAKGILSGRGALIALTAVPIVLVLTAIVSFLTRSKDGMELLGRKTAAVTAVFDYFSKIVVGIGRAIVSALENPGQAIKDLGNAIQENLTNRFQAFGLIIQAVKSGKFKDFTNAVLQLGTGVKDVVGKVTELGKEAGKAAAAGEALARQSQLIADAERKLNVERANSRAQVEKLKLIGDDVTKSNKEREAATRQAFAIENGLLAQQQGLQSRKIANIKGEIALRGVSKDLLDELAEAETHSGELTEESTTRKIELNNKLNQIRIEGAKASLSAQIALTEQSYERARQAGTKNAIELGAIQEKLLNQQQALALVGVVKGSEQEKAIRADYATKRTALNVAIVNEEENRLNAIRQSFLNTQLADVQKNSAEEFELRRGALQQQYFQDVAAAKQTIQNREQLDAKLKELDANYAAGKKAINQDEKAVELKNLDELLAARLIKTRAGSQAEANARKDIIRKQLADALKDENVSIEQFKRLQAQAFSDIEDINAKHAEAVGNKIADRLQTIAGGLSNLADASAQRQNAALKQQQDAALSSAGLSADQRTAIEEKFAAKKAELDRQSAERRRKIATFENAITIARGLVAAIAENVGDPFLQIFESALVIGTGAAQQAVIASTTYAHGGELVDGPSHAQGGKKYRLGNEIIELEGGEAIINKRSTAAYRGVLSHINQAYGGVAFNVPRVQSPRFEYGDILRMNAIAGGGSHTQAPAIDYALLAKMVGQEVGQANASLPAPITIIQDVNNANGKIGRVQDRANI